MLFLITHCCLWLFRVIAICFPFGFETQQAKCRIYLPVVLPVVDSKQPQTGIVVVDWLYCLVSSLHHGKSSSTGNLLEREDMVLPVPDYNMHSRMAAQNAAAVHSRQQRPYSVAVPGFAQVGVCRTSMQTLSSIYPHVHTWHTEPSHEAWQRSALGSEQACTWVRLKSLK